MKDSFLKTGCPWKAKYVFKLTTVATTLYFIIVIKTLSFYVSQALYPIKKQNYWFRNRLTRQKLGSSTSAQWDFCKLYGRLGTLLLCLLWGLLCFASYFPLWQEREFLCFVSPSVGKFFFNKSINKRKTYTWKAFIYKEDSYTLK